MFLTVLSRLVFFLKKNESIRLSMERNRLTVILAVPKESAGFNLINKFTYFEWTKGIGVHIGSGNDIIVDDNQVRLTVLYL